MVVVRIRVRVSVNRFRVGLLRPPDFFNRLTVRKKTG